MGMGDVIHDSLSRSSALYMSLLWFIQKLHSLPKFVFDEMSHAYKNGVRGKRSVVVSTQKVAAILHPTTTTTTTLFFLFSPSVLFLHADALLQRSTGNFSGEVHRNFTAGGRVPPPTFLHPLAGSKHAFLCVCEVLVREVEGEIAATGAHPRKVDAFVLHVVLQHPVVTARVVEDHRPHRPVVREVHGHVLPDKQLVRLLDEFGHPRLAVRELLLRLRAGDPAKEAVHRRQQQRVRRERTCCCCVWRV
jgi:hypothetical protein